MNILAINDKLFLELLPLVLRNTEPKNITVATSVADALKRLKGAATPRDVLLFETLTPEMDGAELFRQIGSMPAHANSPIILLTAAAGKPEVYRALAEEAAEFEAKPFDVELGARENTAAKLRKAIQDAVASGENQNADPELAEKKHAYDLSFQSDIENLERAINYLQLGNQLTQLSRVALQSTQIFAIKIDEMEDIYARASSSEFVFALAEVADAIDDAVKIHGSLISYAGKGIFVCVANSATLTEPKDLESKIQISIYEKDLVFDNGDPLDIEISVGNSIRPQISARLRLDKLLDRAIVRAEKRARTKQIHSAMPNIRLGGPDR